MTNRKPAAALRQDALSVFVCDESPSNAISLAIADHKARGFIDWHFVEALNKAKDRMDAYQAVNAELLAALELTVAAINGFMLLTASSNEIRKRVHRDNCLPALEQARAAIAKATQP